MTFENMYAQCLRLLHHLCITHPHLAVAAAVAEDVMQRSEELVQPRDDDDRTHRFFCFFRGLILGCVFLVLFLVLFLGLQRRGDEEKRQRFDSWVSLALFLV